MPGRSLITLFCISIASSLIHADHFTSYPGDCAQRGSGAPHFLDSELHDNVVVYEGQEGCRIKVWYTSVEPSPWDSASTPVSVCGFWDCNSFSAIRSASGAAMADGQLVRCATEVIEGCCKSITTDVSEADLLYLEVAHIVAPDCWPIATVTASAMVAHKLRAHCVNAPATVEIGAFVNVESTSTDLSALFGVSVGVGYDTTEQGSIDVGALTIPFFRFEGEAAKTEPLRPSGVTIGTDSSNKETLLISSAVWSNAWAKCSVWFQYTEAEANSKVTELIDDIWMEMLCEQNCVFVDVTLANN